MDKHGPTRRILLLCAAAARIFSSMEVVKSLEKLFRSARRAEPEFLEPMKAKAAGALPSYGDWLYELKLDGFRALGIKNEKKVRLLSRNEKDLAGRFPEIWESLQH